MKKNVFLCLLCLGITHSIFCQTNPSQQDTSFSSGLGDEMPSQNELLVDTQVKLILQELFPLRQTKTQKRQNPVKAALTQQDSSFFYALLPFSHLENSFMRGIVEAYSWNPEYTEYPSKHSASTFFDRNNIMFYYMILIGLFTLRSLPRLNTGRSKKKENKHNQVYGFQSNAVLTFFSIPIILALAYFLFSSSSRLFQGGEELPQVVKFVSMGGVLIFTGYIALYFICDSFFGQIILNHYITTSLTFQMVLLAVLFGFSLLSISGIYLPITLYFTVIVIILLLKHVSFYQNVVRVWEHGQVFAIELGFYLFLFYLALEVAPYLLLAYMLI